MLIGLGDALIPDAVSAATKGQYVSTDATGVAHLLPDKAADFLGLLSDPALEVMEGPSTYVSRKDPVLGTVMLPCPTTQVAGAYTSAGSARAWLDAQLNDGNAVLVSLVSVVGRTALCAVLKAVPASDTAALAAASQELPVLASPSAVQKVTSFFTSGFGLLVGAAGLIGILAWASGAFSRKHMPNVRPRGSRKPRYGRGGYRRPRPAGVTWAIAYHGWEWTFETKTEAMQWSRENFDSDERKYVSLYKVG